MLAAAVFWTSVPALSAPDGRPLPRYVSLRAAVVNLRTGPGVRYPVEWVFKRRDLPVEVIAEFETWRKVRDWEGTEGWVHQSMLSGRRFAVVTGAVRGLRQEPVDDADLVARAEPGVIGELTRCRQGEPWCRVRFAGHEGWVRRMEIWGVYPNETVE